VFDLRSRPSAIDVVEAGAATTEYPSRDFATILLTIDSGSYFVAVPSMDMPIVRMMLRSQSQ
jgi:hypothetical protein